MEPTPPPPASDLRPGLVADLARMNPWWSGEPQRPLPATRRHLVGAIHRRLAGRLAPIVAVRGPRQVGKTTALRQVIQDLLDRGVPPSHVLAVQFDEILLADTREPILRIVDWYERAILGKTLNRAAHDGEPTYLFFDEVQNLRAWAPQLKFLVDHSETAVAITGSSALRIEAGRDSLAGRITTLEAGVLSLTELAAFRGIDLGEPWLADNGLEPLLHQDFWRELAAEGRRRAPARDEAFRRFSEVGGYPLAHLPAGQPWEHLADQLNETVVRRVIQKDLLGAPGGHRRDALLLEELFRLACRYAGQAPGNPLFVREIRRTLDTEVPADRIERHFRLLADALLVRLVRPLELRLRRSHGAPKICLADHGLRASWLQEVVPLDPDELARHPELTPLAGHLAESVVGALLSSIPGLDLAHLPARHGEPEVDFVVSLGLARIPVEVKYQRRIDGFRDTEGLRAFLEKTHYRAPFGLLVTQTDDVEVTDPRIVALPLASLLLLR